nr:unnamed protein product [Callosobruchus chinensis]
MTTKKRSKVTFYDPTQDITDLVQSNTSLIMIETPGSITFEISNVEHIVKVAKERGINHSIARLLPCTQGTKNTAHTYERHQNTAMEVAKWLEKHSKIKKVLYPALPSHPQHELWKSYFKGASGTFSIALDREYSCEELSCMVDHMKIFSIGASWGGCDSLILPIDRRSMSRSVMNSDYGGSFIRICCGLEDSEDLIFDLMTH